MNMEIIDRDQSSASAAIKSDRDIVFELWSDHLVHRALVSRDFSLFFNPIKDN